MDSMHPEWFAIAFMGILVIFPAVAYVAVRMFGAHEAASDHPVVHQRRH